MIVRRARTKLSSAQPMPAEIPEEDIKYSSLSSEEHSLPSLVLEPGNALYSNSISNSIS